MFIDKNMKKIEYSIAGNDVVPQNKIGDIFLGTPCISVIMGELNCIFLIQTVWSESNIDVCSELHLTPTRITSHSRSLLDAIMVSSSLIVKDSGVVDTGISDHSMVFCTLKLRATKPPHHIHSRESLKHYDPNQFATQLSRLRIPFNMVFFTEDVDDKLYLFNQLFINRLNDHAPIKHIKVKGKPQFQVYMEGD
jgi:hypothetical protein